MRVIWMYVRVCVVCVCFLCLNVCVCLCLYLLMCMCVCVCAFVSEVQRRQKCCSIAISLFSFLPSPVEIIMSDLTKPTIRTSIIASLSGTPIIIIIKDN